MADKKAVGWKTDFAKQIKNLTGYYLGTDHIHSDENGFHYYIRQLEPGRPLLLMHYRGPLMAVIPNEDYQKLETGEIDVDTYINTSHFYFGYFWGGGSLYGIYWQPFEEASGIHDKEKILRYLKILSCRTHRQSSGYSPTAESCMSCIIDCRTCPFSSLNKTGSWENEVQEYDPRTTFFNEITELTKCTFVCSHTENNNEVHLHKLSDTCLGAYVPQHILNDMLYHPEKNWSNLVDSLTIL